MTNSKGHPDSAPSTWAKTGWAEVISTIAGRYVTTNGEGGIALEKTAEAVQADIDDLSKEKAASALEALKSGDFSDIGLDEDYVAECREEGMSDEEIAQAWAEGDVEEFEVHFVGLDVAGRVFSLDPSTSESLYELHRPDR